MPELRSNSTRLACYLAAAFIATSPAGIASAQTADTDPVQRQDPDRRQGFFDAAGAGDRRMARSSPPAASAAMKKLAGDKAKLIDLGGRTVIPGLTDGHIHGIRAALTFGTEVNWIGVPTLKEALEKIRVSGEDAKARLLDRRRRRLDRGAIRREAPANTGGGRSSWRPTIPSTSSISMTGCCCRRRRWRR